MGASAHATGLGARLAIALAIGACMLFTATGTAAGPTVEAAGGAYGYYWNPASASTTPGATVTFTNPSASVLHGLSWKGGPETPACAGVPVNDAKTSWSGDCTFAQAGSYSYVCYVHPEMTGTVAVGSGTPEQPGPTPPGTDAGPVASQLRIAKRQRGTAVRGSLEVRVDGGRLDVRLFAARAVLLGQGGGRVRVGRIVRSVPAGRVSFAVPLKRVARRALGSGAALPLSARVAVEPQSGERYEQSRGLVLRSGKSTGGAG